MVGLERGEIVRIFGTELRELALEPTHPSGEIRRELPVATAGGVYALPPGVPDRGHDLAGPGEQLRELLERQWRSLHLRIVAHLAIVRTCVIHDAGPLPPFSRTSGRARSHYRGVLPSRRGISRDARRFAKAAADTTGSRAAE